MPNNFTRHGITHLSPSSVNMFAESPDAWVARYLLGHKFTFAPAARGGTMVEDAVVHILQGADMQSVIDTTLAEYRKANLFTTDKKVETWSESMPEMIRLAVKELEQYGKPEFEDFGEQKKIGICCNMGDYIMPITGFTDLDYPQHNLVVDLKCTQRIPSEMSDAHKRQGAIYKQATGRDVKFLYVSGKKAVWHDVGDVTDILSEFKGIVARMNALLSLETEKIKELVPVIDSYYWSDDMALRKELYGY